MSLQKKDLVILHDKLREELVKIPSNRNMIYTQVSRDNLIIGKPRFDPPSIDLEQNLEEKLLEFIEKCRDYFVLMDYKVRDDLEDFLNLKEFHNSKYSPIFLIEQDVWKTDGVYGDYLIEEKDIGSEVNYTRRGQKRGNVNLELDSFEKSIIADARKQIVTQFERIWKSLAKEIEKADVLFERSQIKISNRFLQEQFESSEKLLAINPIAACLIMGRCLELFCRMKLNIKTRVGLAKMIVDANTLNIISNSEYVIFDEIRDMYNSLKHELTYEIDPEELKRKWLSFADIFKSKI